VCLACGSPESPAAPESGSGSDLPPVSAAVPAPSPEARRCLALVEERSFQSAASVCRDARRANPADQEVRAALLVAEAHLREGP